MDKVKVKLQRVASVILVLICFERCASNDSEVAPSECPVFFTNENQVLSFCSDNESDSTVVLQREQDQFIWQALNLYYFWQSEVFDLSDERFASYDELHTFLNQFDNTEVLFESLLSREDRFSWIVDNYIELDNSFQGISKSFGYEFRVARQTSSSNELFGYVEYVVPNSPASDAQLVRGDIFTTVDGIALTIDNYIGLLFESESYTLGLANFINEEFVTNGEAVSLAAIELTENPIFLSETLDIDGVKIGYLIYNQFINDNNFHRELNQVFGEFKANGVTELVLDLRYNPGGSLTTSRILASMVYGAARQSDVFGKIIYNDKLSDSDTDFNFFEQLPILDEDNRVIGEETMNRLSINRVFILTGGSTASASELIIAGLQPYIDVTLIGATTVGKNQGSFTLYDSPNQGFLSNEPDEINPNHTYAMQPIVSQLANSELFTDYTDGFSPDVAIDELDFFNELTPLGDIEEPLLREAIAIINGLARVEREPTSTQGELIVGSRAYKEHLQRTIMDLPMTDQPLEFH